MQSEDENKASKIRKDISKSQTYFRKHLPSYVVAFALKETYDDLITAQQMICNKKSSQERSPQESTNSITSTNSLKMLNDESEQADKLNQINSISSMGSMTPTNSLKHLSSEEVSDTSLITIGGHENIVIDLSEADAEYNINETAVRDERDSMSENSLKVEKIVDEDKKPCERVMENAKENMNGLICCIENNKRKISDVAPKKESLKENENINEDIKNVMCNLNMEPESIVQTSKNNHKGKKKKNIPKRKPKKTVTIKQNNFKHKNPRKVIVNRLVKYYENRNWIGADQIQKELYSDEVSNVVSRTHVFHKIIARVNSLDESEFISFINDVGLNEYDCQSVNSSLSTDKKSIISNISQTTLKQNVSKTFFKDEDEQNAKTVNSLIKIRTENSPYKSDVINVALVVAYSRSNVNSMMNDESVPVPSKDKFMPLESLTSSEMVAPYICNLTSNSPSKFEDFKAVTIETSDGTLVNKNSSFDVSSNDFVIARTSSDFTRSSDESIYTLKNNIETVVDIETVVLDYPVKDNTLLETVINLGIYPEMVPSTSSDTPYENNNNNVIITKNINNKYQVNSNKGDNKEQEISNNILKKSLNQQKDKVIPKNIHLPNQAEIKALLNDSEVPQMKCAEEFRHPSYYMPEMWDGLVLTLEMAVRKLEDNLVEKIVKEFENILGGSPQDVKNKGDSFPREISTEIKSDEDQSMQCDLINNTTIDQIMRKFSIDGPKIFEPVVAARSLMKSKLSKDFEVLKSPEVSAMVAESGDAVTVSTVTYEVCNFRRFKTLFEGPINFVRENVFVITSVPTFFVVLLCVYGFIVFLIKPW